MGRTPREQEDGHLQAMERDPSLRRHQPCRQPDLRPPAPRPVRQYISVVYATLLVVLYYGSPSQLIYK